MKVLVPIQPAYGEFHPMVPLARALEQAGHEVAFACARSFCTVVESTGLRAFPLGLDWDASEIERTFPEWPGLSPDEQRFFWVGHICATVTAPRMAADMLTLATEWRPDLVVRDFYEWGSYVAAECLDIPHVTAGIGLVPPVEVLRMLAGAPLNDLRGGHGLQPDPELASLWRHLCVHYLPPSFAPVPSGIERAHVIRPPIFDRSNDAQAPLWLHTLAHCPTVYVTLGTVFNRERHIFEAILAGLRDGPINLVVTIGRNQDPNSFGPQPGHVHIEQYVPQTLLLPSCDLIITHGGYNTTMAALSHGVPEVFIPLGADQPFNAERCIALGTASVLQPDAVDPGSVRASMHGVLQSPGYRANAQRLQAEIHAMPDEYSAVSLLEELVADRSAAA